MEPSPTPTLPESITPTPETCTHAPIWHTVILLALLLGSSFLGGVTHHASATHRSRVPQYLLTLGWQWLLFGYVWFGLRLRKIPLREIIGGRWKQFEDFLMDVVIAVLFWFTAGLVLAGAAYLLGFADVHKVREARKALEFLLPFTLTESLLWVALSMTAGFCEEVIFRGYLQRQMRALTRSAWVGMVLSAVFFGASHGYEGPTRMVLIALFGFMFGLLAHFRKSLRPGMMSHALHDTASGLLSRFVHVMI